LNAHHQTRLPTPLKINSEVEMISFIKELWAFLSARKKIWLVPIIISMVLLGVLLIAAQGSILAPFIYTLF
jgi:hypothetical protein